MTTLITIREAISLIRKGLREVNADSRLWNKQAYNVLTSHLKPILSRDSDAFRLTNRESLYQTLKCVEIEEAPAIDPCCGLRTRCVVYRTKDKLPDLLEDSMGPKIRLVAPIDMQLKLKGKDTSINVTTPTKYIIKLENPWEKWNVDDYSIWHDERLYFSRNYHRILIEGLFLYDISGLSPCDDQTCIKTLDRKIYATEREIKEAIGKSIEELAGIYLQRPEQTIIDKNDNTK